MYAIAYIANACVNITIMNALDYITSETRPGRSIRPSIMTVDDEADIVKAIINMFEARGYPVSGALRSEEALEVILGDSPPKLVLLDIQLSGDDINGIDLLKKIKAGGFKGIVCILSGDDSPGRMTT